MLASNSIDFTRQLIIDVPLVLAERDEAMQQLATEWDTLKTDLTEASLIKGGGRDLTTNAAQTASAEAFAPFIPRLKTLQKHINEVHKLP